MYSAVLSRKWGCYIAVVPKIKVTRPTEYKPIITKPNSPTRRHINRSPSLKASNSPPIFTAVQAPMGNPQHALQDKGVIDSGCSRHMTGNMSYLSDFDDINVGYVAFGGNPKGGKIFGKGKIRTGKLDFDDVYFVKELKFNLFSISQMCDKKNSVLFTETECLVLSPEFKLPDENQVLLRVPKENNMYNVNLKNIVSSRDLTCLFIKATINESNLWHRRLGHINFKTMNKLVKGNLVRVLPTIFFENDNTCIACKKGKQHRASWKTKPVNFVKQPLYRLHVDLFGPTFVKRLNKKSYSLFVIDDYSSRTQIVQETLHVNFLENKPNVAEKAREEIVQQYVLFPVWSSGSTNPYTTDEDVAFDEKEHEFDEKNPESEVNVSPSNCAQSKKHDDKNKKEAKGKNHVVAAGPSNVVASLTHGKSSCIDTSQLPDDTDMPELEDITYSDDEDDVGAEADFNNLETSITVSPIPTTRVHKDHPVTQIIGDQSLATQTRSMTRLTKDQGRKSATTPIDIEKPLLKDPDGKDVDVHTYRSMIGSLMYLTLSRPDIMFAVCACARFQVTPKASHLHAVKRIFRYLKSKSHLGLWYPKDSPFDLVAYLDSDYAGASLYRKSTTGGFQFLGCRLIFWECKKQTVEATSSTEAEYVVLSAGSLTSQQMVLNSPCLTHTKNWLVQIKGSLSWLVQKQMAVGVNTPRCDEDRLELIELTVFLLPKVEKVGVEFWTTVVVKKVNNVTRLQALVDKKKVVITEATIRDSLRLDDVEGVVSAVDGVVPTADEEPYIPSPTPPTPPPQPSHISLLLPKGIIENIDADEDVVLEDAKDVAVEKSANVENNANIQGRIAESQAEIYKIDLDHANKVLSIKEEESEPIELQKVVDVVTTAKIITEVVTASSTTITAADVPIPTATTVAAPTLTVDAPTLTTTPSRRTNGVMIRDPKESTPTSTIIHSEAKSKDKGKRVLVDEPKPLKKKAQIEQDAKYARELEAEKPQTEAQARKNMMIYLKNVAGFKMDYFKGMSYDDIRPVFEKYFDSNVAFLQKTKEQMDEKDSRAL
nr:putative ribonuclease H-like domain-containing protein [Tanacetum cinerariifolium]